MTLARESGAYVENRMETVLQASLTPVFILFSPPYEQYY